MNTFYMVNGRMTIDKSQGQTQLNYTFNWGEWLPAGYTINGNPVIVATGIELLNSSHSDGFSDILVRGGVLGEEASASCEITTTGDPVLIERRTIYFKIVVR